MAHTRGDVTGKTATAGFLDPDKGMVGHFRAQLFRDNWDLFLLKNDQVDRGIVLAYGKNLRGVTWTRRTDQLITRVVPVAKNREGGELFLPEAASGGPWVDSPNIGAYPVVNMQRIKVEGQIGKAKGDESGEEWTEASLYAQMQTKAEERFSVDHADLPMVSVTVDFTLLGDTAEYAQYKGLQKIYMYDTVRVVDSTVGLDVRLQVSEIEWDCILERYNGIKLGDVFDFGGRTVAAYQMGDGAIDYEKLSQQTISRIISEAR